MNVRFAYYVLNYSSPKEEKHAYEGDKCEERHRGREETDHLEQDYKILRITLTNLKLDQVNCANIWSWTLGHFPEEFFGGQIWQKHFGWKVVENIRWKIVGEKYLVENI